MSWLEFHEQSEKLAMDAAASFQRGERDIALRLYGDAAKYEENALAELDSSKLRTRGVTAVSAVALWFKAAEYDLAEGLADAMLADQDMPDFAREQLKDLVQVIKTKGRDRYEQAAAPSLVIGEDKHRRAPKLHMAAAKHHEDAAYHHREAAKHYATGDHEKAGYHAYMAYSHCLLAVEETEKVAVSMTRGFP